MWKNVLDFLLKKASEENADLGLGKKMRIWDFLLKKASEENADLGWNNGGLDGY